jgi:uncharacterized SAM-binding protein YcdF (DUF218 family)
LAAKERGFGRMLRALGRGVKLVLLSLGALLALVTIAPPRWYAEKLAGDWPEPKGSTLIVLGGDSVEPGMIGLTSYWRTMYASMAWKSGGYRYVVLSGEQRITDPMRDFLTATGVPREVIGGESKSTSTRENALFTAQLVHEYPGPYVLLTSDYHMYRAQRAFRRAGVTVVPRPFPDALKRMNDWRLRWDVFVDLVQESGKIGYYWARGWI